MTYTIRKFNEHTDMAQLVQLSKQFFSEYEKHHEFFEIDNLTDEGIKGYFSLWLNDKNYASYIAYDDEHIIGYINVYITTQPDFWKIKRLGDVSGFMVDMNYRRTGVGKLLFDHALEFFKEQNVHYYTLYTSVENQSAIKFYLNEGMEPLYTHLYGKVDP